MQSRHPVHNDRITAMTCFARRAAALALAACACPFVSVAAPTEADLEQGLPLLKAIAPSTFDSPLSPVGPQAFDLERLADGSLLVANNEGLLRLLGTGSRTWSPLRGVVFAVAARNDGTVFVGGVADLGYFERFGHDFVSLAPWSEKLGIPFGEFWVVLAGEPDTYFADRQRAYRWDGKAMTLVYEAQGEIRKGAAIPGLAAILDPGAGLIALTGGAARRIEGSDALLEAGDCALIGAGASIVSLCGDGALRFWSAQGLQRTVVLDAALASQLAKAHVMSLAVVEPQGYAVGTRTSGLFLLGAGGELVGRLSQAAGLEDVRIFDLLGLGTDGLWLARDYGLALVEWPGQVSRYDTAIGLPRVPFGVARAGGVMYFGTARGIYRLASAEKGFPVAEPHALTDEVLFDLEADGATLFAATRKGLYAIEDGHAQMLDPRLCYEILVHAGPPLRLLVVSDRDAWIMERGAAGWRSLGNLPMVRSEIRRIVEESPTSVWLSSRSARQLYRVSWPSVATAWSIDTARVDDFRSTAGAPAGPIVPLKFPDGLAFAAASGIFRFDAATREFEPDLELTKALPSERGEVRDALSIDAERVVVVQHDSYRMLRRSGSAWELPTTPLARIPRGASPRSLTLEPDGTIWVATSDAIYRHRPRSQSALPSMPRPRIELARDTGEARALHPDDTPLDLGVAPMRLSFRFSNAGLLAAEEVRFRSRLTPVERDFSAWSASPLREFAYVPGGDYTLEVEALDVFDRASAPTRVQLHLDSPWYQRTWAAVLAAATLILAMALVVRANDRRLRTRAAALEELVRERTRALEEASVTDQLTGLRNRRYFDAAVLQLQVRRHGVFAALIDVDHFKRINDTLGHDVGDRVLQKIAARLVEAAPRESALFRWGGEEFLILARPNVEGFDHVALACGLLDCIGRTPIETRAGETIAVTCSIGWEILSPQDGAALRGALRRADARLYEAKRAGRDRGHGPDGAVCGGTR